jgi:beta-lactamase regulating signal transducer with metallopeptidase domain
MLMTLLLLLVKLTVSGSVMVLAVLLLRLVFRAKLPRIFIVFMWLLAFAAFVIPVSLPTPPFVNDIGSRLPTSSALKVNDTSQQISQPATSQNSVNDQTNMSSLDANTASSKPQSAEQHVTAMNPYLAVAIIYGCITFVLMTLLTVLYTLTIRRFRTIRFIEDSNLLKGLRKKAGVRCYIPLGLSRNTGVPVTVGVFRPKIVLPEDFDFQKEDLTSHIYMHELIHMRRRDNVISLISLYISCIHWFNPLAWFAYSILCRDLELACDSAAVKLLGLQSRAEYAQSLIVMAGKKKDIRSMFLTAFGRYDIKERVTNVMRTGRLTVKALTVSVLSLLLVSTSFCAVSCTKAATPVETHSVKSTSQTVPKMMQKFLKMSDSEITNKLSSLDLSVTSLRFTDSRNISSETLFTFYNYITGNSTGEYPKDYILKWYSKKDKKFHVPVSDIKQVLNKYFDATNFNPEKIDGYNKETGEIDRIIDGFGGGRCPKLTEKQKISNDTMIFTLANYDDKYKILYYYISFTIRFSDTGYKYISIVEN